MPSISAYLARVLITEEQMKERLREKILAALDADELLSDPAGVVDALFTQVLLFTHPYYVDIEGWGIDFAQTINNGKPVVARPGAASDDGMGWLSNTAGLVLSKFMLDFEATVGRMQDAGMAPVQIRGTLAEGLLPSRPSPLFSSLVQGLIQASANGVQLVSNTAYLQSLAATPGQPEPEEKKWVWVTVEDTNVCPDCASRHNEMHTLIEWGQLGRPKAGATICGGRCRCMIMPEDFADEEFDMRQPIKFNRAAVLAIGDRAAALSETR